MSFLFGGNPPTISELANRHKRDINRTIRGIDREIAKLNQEERSLMAEVKKTSSNDLQLSFQKAQSVVRNRRMLSKCSVMKSHMQGIAARIQNVKTMEGLQRAVSGTAQLMKSFNTRMGGVEMVASLHELERQNMAMIIQGEVVDGQMDSVFEEDNDSEESEDVVMQVMTEAGVCLPSVAAGSFAEQLSQCRVPARPLGS